MVYKPKKALVVQFIDGDFFEGDTYEELISAIFRQRREDYAGSEAETRLQMRADLAEGWLTAAKVTGLNLQNSLDVRSDETLIRSTAKSGWLRLYKNQATTSE